MVRAFARACLAIACAVPFCWADPAVPADAADEMRETLQTMAGRVSEEASGHDMGGIPAPQSDIYQLYISSQDGPHCSFRQTCSGYAKEAVRKKGWIMGFVLAADRLLRCHGLSSGQYPVDSLTGKFLDPVP